jgi:hypothetical protein
MTPHERKELSALAQTVLIARHRGEVATSDEAFDEIRSRWEWIGVSFAVFTWMQIAQMASGLTPEEFGDDAFAIPFAFNKDGELLDMSTAEGAIPIGMQIFSTFLSGEYETAQALFVTAVNKGLGSEIVTFMLSICLSVSRTYLDTAETETMERP